MGVTLTLTRRQLLAAAILLVLLLLLRWREASNEAGEAVTPDSPLVLGSPELRVVSGPDTTVIRGPAVFAYSGMDSGEGTPSRSSEEDARLLQSTMLEAEPGLREMGVRVISVAEPPVVVGIAPDVDAAAGPRLVPGAVGFLLADPPSRILRLDRVPSGAALVCAAARTFEKTPPPAFAAACR